MKPNFIKKPNYKNKNPRYSMKINRKPRMLYETPSEKEQD